MNVELNNSYFLGKVPQLALIKYEISDQSWNIASNRIAVSTHFLDDNTVFPQK